MRIYLRNELHQVEILENIKSYISVLFMLMIVKILSTAFIPLLNDMNIASFLDNINVVFNALSIAGIGWAVKTLQELVTNSKVNALRIDQTSKDISNIQQKISSLEKDHYTQAQAEREFREVHRRLENLESKRNN